MQDFESVSDHFWTSYIKLFMILTNFWITKINIKNQNIIITKGGSRAAATSKMERFVIIGNGFRPLTIITKRSILDVAAALDPPLITYHVESSNSLPFACILIM